MPKRSVEDFGSVRESQILEASDRKRFSEVFQVTDSNFLLEEILFARVISTENITLLSGLIEIDDITLETDDYVLVNGQDNVEENGLYQAQSTGWNRVLTGFVMKSGMPCIIREGSVYANTFWVEELEFATYNAGLTDVHWVQTSPPVDIPAVIEEDTHSINMTVTETDGDYYVSGDVVVHSTDAITMDIDEAGVHADLVVVESSTIEHEITESGLLSHLKLRLPTGNTVVIHNDDFEGIYAEVITAETNTVTFEETDEEGLKADVKHQNTVTADITDDSEGIKVEVNYAQSLSVQIDTVNETDPIVQKGLRARVRKHDSNTFVWNDDHANGINGTVQVKDSASVTMTNDHPDGIEAEISTLWKDKINKWWKIVPLSSKSGSGTSYSWLMPQDLGDYAIPEGVYGVYVRLTITQNDFMPSQPANNASPASLTITTPIEGAVTVAVSDQYQPAPSSSARLIVNEIKGFCLCDFRGEAAADRQVEITVALPNGTGGKSAVGTMYIWEVDLTEEQGSWESY